MYGREKQCTALQKVKYRARQWLGLWPALFFPAARFLGNKRRRSFLVSPSTELVIEGFPRSGNTFAVAAFTLSQPRPVRIARHHHVPAQIIYAVKHGIPTLIVIREPSDAVLSLVIREPCVSIKDGLRSYRAFHKRILPYAHGFVVATFEEVTTDFGKVITKINNQFGTEFVPFIHVKENVEKCFRLIEKWDLEDTGQSQVMETTVARPSDVRKRLKEDLRKLLELEVNAVLLEQARETYGKFLEIA